MDTYQRIPYAKIITSTITITFTILGTVLFIFTQDVKFQKTIGIISFVIAFIFFVVFIALKVSDHEMKDIRISNIKSLIEREKKAKEVWVITPELNMDVISTMANGEFKSAVEENIRSGVQYRYIAPDTTTILNHIKKYKKEYGSYIKGKHFLLLPDSEFINFFNEVVIYDPGKRGKASFVYPPSIKNIYEDVLEIDIEMTINYIKKFRKIWEDEENKPSSEQRFV